MIKGFTINLSHSYVECDLTSVFISAASLSSPTRHFLSKFSQQKESRIVSRYIKRLKITKYDNSINETGI